MSTDTSKRLIFASYSLFASFSFEFSFAMMTRIASSSSAASWYAASAFSLLGPLVAGTDEVEELEGDAEP